jgi:hypothetical protein
MFRQVQSADVPSSIPSTCKGTVSCADAGFDRYPCSTNTPIRVIADKKVDAILIGFLPTSIDNASRSGRVNLEADGGAITTPV